MRELFEYLKRFDNHRKDKHEHIDRERESSRRRKKTMIVVCLKIILPVRLLLVECEHIP